MNLKVKKKKEDVLNSESSSCKIVHECQPTDMNVGLQSVTIKNCFVKTGSQEQLTVAKRPADDNIKEICSLDCECDKSGSIVQKALDSDLMAKIHTLTLMTCIKHCIIIFMSLL